MYILIETVERDIYFIGKSKSRKKICEMLKNEFADTVRFGCSYDEKIEEIDFTQNEINGDGFSLEIYPFDEKEKENIDIVEELEIGYAWANMNENYDWKIIKI